MSFETKDDPVLIFADLHYLCFGIHGATSPTYRGTGWTRRYSAAMTGYPAWPGEYLRCKYGGNGLMLPDHFGRRAPTPNTINRRGLPWLRSTFSKDIVMCGGDPLSKVAETFARFGGEFFVPIIRVGAATWKRWDAVRAACLKAGGVIDDSERRRGEASR